MGRKLALKRLTASDLTFFRWHYEHRPAGNQKAINLDAKVLVGQFYPRLGEPHTVPHPRFNLELILQGPGLAGPYSLVRKILLQQKNWRLNGEFIFNPLDDPNRFNDLAPGDFAVLEFGGESAPEQVKMHLVAQGNPQDAPLHAAIESRYVNGSMWSVTEEALAVVMEAASLPSAHPLRGWIDGATVEDAGRGGAEGIQQINRRRQGRGMSAEELLKARDAAQKTGVEGEALVNELLDGMRQRGDIDAYEWTSSSNAIAPYDFAVTKEFQRFVDVKSTVGAFGGPIHMSIGELIFATSDAHEYDIYRVFGVGGSAPGLRVARNIGQALAPVMKVLNELPPGIAVDSISMDPSILPFDEEVILLGEYDLSPDPD